MESPDKHPANAAESPSDPSPDTVLPPPPPASRELSWGNALGKLRQSRAQLRELRNKGTVRVQRLIGRATTLLPPTPFGALCGVFDTLPLSAENVLLGLTQGIYALEFNGTVRWHCPPERFIVYLRELQVSPSIRRELRRVSYTVTFDRAPREVLAQCASEHGSGQGTWLSERLGKIYMELFEMGAMHTVEVWQDGALVGGSIGVTIGRVWTAESMFHRAPHVGKVQLAALTAHLLERDFELVDGQQYSDHFARFGARDVTIAEYRAALARGLAAPARFYADGVRPPLASPSAPPASAAPGSTIPGIPASARNTAVKKRQNKRNQNGGGDHDVS